MAPLRSTLGRSIGNLLGLGRTKDLAGVGAGGAALDSQLNSRYRGGTRKDRPNFDASGGTTYTGPNDMKYHIFDPTTPAPGSSFVVNDLGDSTSVTLLLVAGGGGGGSQHGGGGGAGALFYREDYPVAETTYPVSVGGSGAAGTGPNGDGGAGGNSIMGSVQVNGGGYGGGMNNPGGPGGSGGGGGMRPTAGSGRMPGGSATGSPTDPGSPYVHAYDGGSGSDYEGASPAAGIGGGGGGAASLGSSTPETVSPTGPWPAATGAVSPTNYFGQGGNDYGVPTTFMPTDVVLGIAAEMGSPTSFLGIPIAPTFSPTPYVACLMFGGGGGGGSHAPWGNFNNNGEYPTGGGGSGTSALPGWGTGGVGGEGNSDNGQPGVNFRGGGGGGSGGAGNPAGAGGHGICIVAYPI